MRDVDERQVEVGGRQGSERGPERQGGEGSNSLLPFAMLIGGLFGFVSGYFIGFQLLSSAEREAHFALWEQLGEFGAGDLFASPVFWKLAIPALLGLSSGLVAAWQINARLIEGKR